MKKKKTNRFDFNAYMHKLTDAIEESFWRSDSEFTINITNRQVLSNQSLKDAVISSVFTAVSTTAPIIFELSMVSNNQLMFQINETGKAKKRMILDMYRNSILDNSPTSGFFEYDCNLKYLIIVNGVGNLFVDMTNVKPEEKQEALDFSFKLINQGYKLMGGYDLLKLEYEQTGSISYNHHVSVCTFS